MVSKLRLAFAFFAAASLVSFVAFHSQGEGGPTTSTRALWFVKPGIQDAKARLLTDRICNTEPTRNFTSPVFINQDVLNSRLVLLIKMLSSVNEFVEDWECYLNTF